MPDKVPTIAKKAKTIEKKAKATVSQEMDTEKGAETMSQVLELKALKSQAKKFEKEKNEQGLKECEEKIYAIEKQLADGEKNNRLTELKTEARMREKRGKKGDEEHVLGVLEPEIRKLEGSASVSKKEQEIGEIKTKEIATEAIDANKEDSKLDTEAIRVLNAKEIEDLRKSILQAQESDPLQTYIDKSNDSDIAWLSGDVEKSSTLHGEKNAMEQGLRDEAAEKMENSMMSWYEGDYDTAKKDQDREQRIKSAIGIGEPIPKTSAIEQKKKEPLSDVERYGQDTLDEVKKIRTEEMQRLVNLRLPRATILKRMADFEKVRINPILRAQDKTTPTESYQSIGDMTKKKEEEKKKNSFWSKFKSIFE